MAGDTVRFVHAADLHLDAPFQGVAADDERVGAELAQATYAAFSRVVDACLEHEVDFLVIAGDAYNSADRSLRAQLAFRKEVSRLAEQGIGVYLTHGNHDPLSGWSAGLSLPNTVHVFGASGVERVEFERDGQVAAVLYGRSFAKTAETAGFADGYRRDPADPIAIGVLHANVGGNPDHDPYAPATLEELRAGGMDYWALGHIHKHEVLSQNPWVVYAGSPQGLNPRETGVHGCMLVEVGRAGVIEAQYLETAPIVWASDTIDVSQAEDIDAVSGQLAEACERLRDQAQGRSVVARLVLTGRTEAHGDLKRPGVLDALLEDLRAEQVAAYPWLWVDRLDGKTASVINLDELRGTPEFPGELVRIADAFVADSQAAQALIDELVAPVSTALQGYRPQMDAAALIAAARDIALDQVLAGGDRS